MRKLAARVAFFAVLLAPACAAHEDADEVKRLSGVDEVYAPEALGEHLARALGRGSVRALYTPLHPAEGASMSRDLALRLMADLAADPWDGRGSREGRFVELLRARFPMLEVKDLSPALDGASGESYYSLIAGGENAWYPHYNAGRRRMRDGELLLMDFAPDVGQYQSDVTRMWPVNGRFTPEQRALYGFYLRCYRALIAAIRAGRTPAEILAEALREWDKAALEARFVKPEHAAAARAFVAESKASAEERPYLGHWVGMATHDVGSHAGPLRPGMAFTIEPQFRVPEGKIYIRLEDLIVVKENGIEVVSDWLPSDPDAIEKAMAEEGLLQRYPRDEDFDALQP